MGLLRNRTDEPGGERFLMREKLLSIGDDFWIERKLSIRETVEIERDGDTIATISKKWFRVRESYGVDVAADADIPLILAITVAIDSLTSPE